MADDRRLLLQLADDGAVVVGHLSDCLVSEDLRMRLRLRHRLRMIRPPRLQCRIAGLFEKRCPTVPAAREQPETVNEHDRVQARCVCLLDLVGGCETCGNGHADFLPRKRCPALAPTWRHHSPNNGASVLTVPPIRRSRGSKLEFRPCCS